MDTGIQNYLKRLYKTNTSIIIPDKADAIIKKKSIQNKNRSQKRQEKIDKNKNAKNKNKNKPKRIKKHEFKYDSKNDTFQCPKTKKLLKVVKIVKIKGEKKKKYSCDLLSKLRIQTLNAHHNIKELSMNTMTKISTLYANYTIQTNDKKYIIKEDTMQRPASQFY